MIRKEDLVLLDVVFLSHFGLNEFNDEIIENGYISDLRNIFVKNMCLEECYVSFLDFANTFDDVKEVYDASYEIYQQLKDKIERIFIRQSYVRKNCFNIFDKENKLNIPVETLKPIFGKTYIVFDLCDGCFQSLERVWKVPEWEEFVKDVTDFEYFWKNKYFRIGILKNFAWDEYNYFMYKCIYKIFKTENDFLENVLNKCTKFIHLDSVYFEFDGEITENISEQCKQLCEDAYNQLGLRLHYNIFVYDEIEYNGITEQKVLDVEKNKCRILKKKTHPLNPIFYKMANGLDINEMDKKYF